MDELIMQLDERTQKDNKDKDQYAITMPGREEIAQRLSYQIDLLKHPDPYLKFKLCSPKPFIISGPHGSGKTYVIEAYAKFLNRIVVTIDCAESFSFWGSEKWDLDEEIDELKSHAPHAILALDNLDELCVKREVLMKPKVRMLFDHVRLLPQLGIIIIGMTSCPEKLAPLFNRSSLFGDILPLPRSPRALVESVLQERLAELPHDEDLPLKPLSYRLTGRSLCDVVYVLEQAAAAAARERAERIGASHLKFAQTLLFSGSLKDHAAFFSGANFQLPGHRALAEFFNREVVEPLRLLEEGVEDAFPESILLYGESGSGKSYAVKQLAAYLGWYCAEFNAASTASPYIHDTPKKMREIFEQAAARAPALVIIDEAEHYLGRRELGDRQYEAEESAELLRLFAEARERNVLLIGITNLLERIEPAMLRPGRFGLKFRLDHAAGDDLQELVRSLLVADPNLQCNSAECSASIARALEGRTTAQVAELMRLLRREAWRQHCVTMDRKFIRKALPALLRRFDEECRPPTPKPYLVRASA